MQTQPHRTEAGRLAPAFITVLALVSGCDREAPAASPPAAPIATPAAETSKPTFTLIMTWMYGAQPPQTTQTVFHDEAACDQARDAAIAEGRRLALEAISDPTAAAARPAPPPTRRYIGSALLPGDDAATAAAGAPQSTAPKVAAICAVTSAP